MTLTAGSWAPAAHNLSRVAQRPVVAVTALAVVGDRDKVLRRPIAADALLHEVEGCLTGGG